MHRDQRRIDEAMRVRGTQIGEVLESAYPAVKPPGYEHAVAIPHAAVEPIADAIQLAIAEVIQSWIDAGSEREVTMENEQLHEALVAELFGWSDHPDNGPVQANGDRDTD